MAAAVTCCRFIELSVVQDRRKGVLPTSAAAINANTGQIDPRVLFRGSL